MAKSQRPQAMTPAERKPEKRMQEIDAQIFRKAVCFTLSLPKFCNRRQGDISKVREDGNTMAGNRFKLSKKLIESPELDAIADFQAKLYRWVTMRSNPTGFKDGLYLVKNEMVPEFEAKLAESLKTLREVLIPAFQAAYPGQIEEARIALNGQFRIQDYPGVNDLPNRFGVNWNWIAFGVPENLSPELRAVESAKISARFAEAELEITAALRDGFACVLAKVVDRLEVEPGGKPKIFRDTLFEDLTEFISTFNARNMTGDSELAAMVTQAQSLLAKVRGDSPERKAQAMRDAGSVRQSTAEAFETVRKAVDSMVMEKPIRRFDFSDSEAVAA